MKTRIIEEINSNGSSTFYPQRKMLFWWLKFEAGQGYYVSFSYLHEAQAWLDFEPVSEIKIHSSNAESDARRETYPNQLDG
jgi:hypothetical protein